MQNNTIELSLLEPEEREQLDFIWNLIPEEDRKGMTEDDVLFVLDAIDDYLESAGLLTVDNENGEMEYLDGDIDEDAQLNYILQAAKAEHRAISNMQIQLILDAEVQYGIEQGWYEEDEE